MTFCLKTWPRSLLRRATRHSASDRLRHRLRTPRRPSAALLADTDDDVRYETVFTLSRLNLACNWCCVKCQVLIFETSDVPQQINDEESQTANFASGRYGTHVRVTS